MRVVALGVSGFLGSWTLRALLELGHDVVGVVREESDLWRLAGLASGMEVQRQSSSRWSATIEAIRPDVVISLDWNGTASGDHSNDATQQSNRYRQAQLVEAAIRSGASRFVGIGSQAEYGLAIGPIPESTAPDPSTRYGQAKVDALSDVRGRATRSGLEWAWARVFSLFGPLDADQRLLPMIFDSVRDGRRVGLTAAEQPWSYLFVGDAARAVAILATHSGVGGIYNVAHPESPPLRQSLLEFSGLLGGEGLLDFGELPDGLNSGSRIADLTRINSTGWRPVLSRHEGFQLTADWLEGGRVTDSLSMGSGSLLPRRAPR